MACVLSLISDSCKSASQFTNQTDPGLRIVGHYEAWTDQIRRYELYIVLVLQYDTMCSPNQSSGQLTLPEWLSVARLNLCSVLVLR
jgi:hypothetical protein